MALFSIPEARILGLMEEEERKAWFALEGYKFWMFGYHAAAWVKYNHLLTEKLPNPFQDLVNIAKGEPKIEIRN